MGLVLGWEGGGLPQLWDVYASGCGGALGNGQQWMNWVHVADVAGFCLAAVANQDYAGVYNLVAPTNSTNREFHRALCEHTPSLSFLAAPKFYLKALMGKRANFLLQAPKVATPRATDQGFTYQYPDLQSALADLVGSRTHPSAHCVQVKQWVPIPATDWPLTQELSTIVAKGPYRLWHHRQRVAALGDGTLVVDQVEYKLPLFPLGQVALRFVRAKINAAYRRRREVLAQLALKAKSVSGS